MNYYYFLIIFTLLLIIELVYFKIAHYYDIKDIPNKRSSHNTITIRGGGVLFPLAVLIAFFAKDAHLLPTVAILAVSLVSFVDDINSLNHWPRLFMQISTIFLICVDLKIGNLNAWFFPLILVLMITWINAFNFMDGINGLIVLYAIVAILSFMYLDNNKKQINLLITLLLSCIIFAFFNVRNTAKTFAGDVGSISLAVFLGYFMLKTIIETQQVAYLLFFSVFGIDSAITILLRLRKKENIFTPHRSHLFQYLANECNIPQIFISIFYAVLQLSINIGVLYLIHTNQMALEIFFAILLFLASNYLLVRNYVVVKKKIG